MKNFQHWAQTFETHFKTVPPKQFSLKMYFQSKRPKHELPGCGTAVSQCAYTASVLAQVWSQPWRNMDVHVIYTHQQPRKVSVWSLCDWNSPLCELCAPLFLLVQGINSGPHDIIYPQVWVSLRPIEWIEPQKPSWMGGWDCQTLLSSAHLLWKPSWMSMVGSGGPLQIVVGADT